MLQAGRRSRISTAEFGLYADRGDRYTRSRYGSVLKKIAIGAMVVVTIVLVAIFLYDFTSATSVNSKVSQESKHMYILQNALRKSSSLSKRPTDSATRPAELRFNRTDHTVYMQDRSDLENYSIGEPEFRAQNLNNFKLRRRVLKSVENGADGEQPEGKEILDNHAIVYRVRQRYKQPDSEEEANSEESRPVPFHWEYKTAHPSSFKRIKYPQLSQYRYPQSSRNIQDIIKYLTNDGESSNRGIKFTGVYVNPKKYDLVPEIGETMSESDRSEEEDRHRHTFFNDDPFYQYKPKHPADVNLLATSNLRFSPTGLSRYHSYHDPFHVRPPPLLEYYEKPAFADPYDASANYASITSGAVKKRKPKPFSVMLDIYPITDIADQQKKTSRPRPQLLDEYEGRRPLQQFNRGKYFSASQQQQQQQQQQQPIPALAVPGQQALSDEEERQQMIFHLNLYPRRKNKLSRHDVIYRSSSLPPEERQRFVERIMSPLESIAKHLTDHSAIEEARFASEKEEPEGTKPAATRYQELLLDETRETVSSPTAAPLPPNHKSAADDDYASTERYEAVEGNTEAEECGGESAASTLAPTGRPDQNERAYTLTDTDTVEGFQRFDDAVLTSSSSSSSSSSSAGQSPRN